MNTPPPTLAGAFLLPCILTRCRAFFLPGCNTAKYKHLQRVFPCKCNLYHQCHKIAHKALQRRFLRLHRLNRPRYHTDTTSHCTTCDTLESIHASGRAQPIPDTTATPGRCTGQHRPPIIIRYIRGQTMPDGAAYRRPCQPGGVSMLPTSGTGSTVKGWQSGTLHRAGQSSGGERGGRRGTIGGFRRISFRAVAR